MEAKVIRRLIQACPHSLLVVVALLLFSSHTVKSEVVVLQDRHWAVSIDPETLQVTCAVADGPPLAISAARPKHAAVTDLRHDARQASWTLRDENVTVEMRLETRN
jgi:hypothetical protein